ncbi:hypothetical protein ANCCEY_03946 [Ancylostoma ceylanicum]|uniref:Ubiquitin-related modifier 1 n=1 Tax=Ancylostoma ceylanicum TaxID=53326 RepID=A0A0D6M0I2_9BILA|nr:hypothetical protein ANCCEY_03946 [Ancylostoma ceylanicum]
MTLPGITGVCVADSNGLALSSRGSLKADAAPVGSQLLTLCSQIEPSSPVPPQVTLLGDHGKVTVPCDGDSVTVFELIRYVKEVMLKDCNRSDLLVEGGTVRPGVLVLVNECDWELLGCPKKYD